MKRILRGGNIDYAQPKDSIGRKTYHLDSRAFPFSNDEPSSNMTIKSKFYDVIPLSSTQGSGGVPQPGGNNNTAYFNVASTSDSLISLSESFFSVNMTITDNPSAANKRQHSLFPFASDLFVENITTKLSQTDVSDSIHNDGLYAFSAFHKQVLMKKAERETYCELPLIDVAGNTITKGIEIGDPAFVTMSRPVSDDVSSQTTFESLGPSNLPIDSQLLFPFNQSDTISNLYGLYNKNVVTPFALCKTKYAPAVPPAAATPSGALLPANQGTIDMMINPTEGIWKCPNYLPTNIRLDVLMKIADTKKWIGVLDPTHTPTVVINSINLILCRVVPVDDALLAMNDRLNSTPLIYNILNSRTEPTSFGAVANAGANFTLGPLLNGVIPNLVLVSMVNTDTYNRLTGTPAGGKDNHMLDACPLSSGFLRKHNSLAQSIANPFNTYAANEDQGVPHISSLILKTGTNNYPLENVMTNYSNQYTGQRFVQMSYEYYVAQCVDSDKPFLSYSHWKNIFTVYVFNLTNNDKALLCGTDETNTGSISLQVSIQTANACPAQTVIVTGLFYSAISIDSSRKVTRIGF